MRFALLITGPAYGTQQASSAYQFAEALIETGHSLESIFFYQEGVLNANQLIMPASDEVNLLQRWQQLQQQHGMALNVCVSAALRRGVTDNAEAQRLGLANHNLAAGFSLTGLGALAETALTCDRLVQF